VSKQIVSYAKTHRRAIAVENLENVRKPKSKIRGYVERSQWAFYQLLSYITYKAALLGVPVIKVNPAYTSQDCSRCGQRTKPNGKVFVCASCGHKDHRDSNSAFNIGMSGNRILDVELLTDSESRGSGVLVTPFLATAEAYAYA
jgi:IS605 OrfB family transposase